MKYDTILLTGDKKASRSVFGMNKSLIELNGVPLFMYVLSALQDVDEVDSIYIVGPKPKIEELLKKHLNPPLFPPLEKGGRGGFKKNIVVVEQKSNLYENVWHTFLSTIKDYRDGDELKNPPLMDKSVFVAAGDMPLITSFEIKEFISKCDMENYDYCLGMIPEHVLKNYYPSNGKAGIKLAYLHLRESRYRISNLHLIKPFRIINREYIEKMYEYRYQKDIRNVVRLTIELIRKHAGFKTLLFYGMVEMAIFMSKIHIDILSSFFKWFVSLESAEKVVSNVLKTRLKLVETSFGGAALDVDNENDFDTIKVMYKESSCLLPLISDFWLLVSCFYECLCLGGGASY
ncbi:MAG: nucleotidyltransferase family protein [Nitrospinae bacterium]|nr:nucleotidyltransferase family protein [Nitrospinota bacterium]